MRNDTGSLHQVIDHDVLLGQVAAETSSAKAAVSLHSADHAEGHSPVTLCSSLGADLASYVAHALRHHYRISYRNDMTGKEYKDFERQNVAYTFRFLRCKKHRGPGPNHGKQLHAPPSVVRGGRLTSLYASPST